MRKEYNQNYYNQNKEKIIQRNKDNQKNNNYLAEKSDEQRRIRYIKRETRRLHPLENEPCQVKNCNKKAEERHHTSIPIEKHKFYFLCHEHHVQLHRGLNLNIVKKEKLI